MSRGRVLLVDDKPRYVDLLRRVLPTDLEIVSASNGAEALELLATGDFDVVISDVRMPGASGMAILEAVRATGRDVEVILMTAYGTIADAVAAMKLGAAEYLTKPFETAHAVAAVEAALERRRQRRAGLAGAGPATTESSDPGAVEPAPISALPYREALAAERERSTREYLIALLREVRGNVTLAAERAGIERESFHRLMKRHGVSADDYRAR